MKKKPPSASAKNTNTSPDKKAKQNLYTLSLTPRPPHLLREAYNADQCLLPLLKMVGWSHFEKAQAQQLTAHQHENTWEICYLADGQVDWWAGDQMYEISKGQIFITHPNELHGGQDAIMHPCELYWVQVELPPTSNKPSNKKSTHAKQLAVTDISQLSHDYQTLQPRLFPGSDSLPALYERLLAEYRTGGPHAPLVVQSTLNTLLVEVLRLAWQHGQHQHEQHTQRTTRIEKIVRWINTHLDEPLTINELAALAELGPSQFRARFTDEVGQSPNSYITAQRISQAKQQLASEPDRAITHIAHHLGFTTSQYFATVFKDRVGMTPGEYRDRYARK